MKLQSLTNVRPTKDLGTQVIASCTKGQFKVTPDAARKLKVTAGDYLDVLQDQEAEGESLYVKVGEQGDGGKLAGDGTLTFSAAVAWNNSQADEDHNTHYNLGDAVEVDGVQYFPLEFVEKKEKMQRNSRSEDASEGGEAVEASSSDEGASFEEL